jgi:hypothetical protein
VYIGGSGNKTRGMGGTAKSMPAGWTGRNSLRGSWNEQRQSRKRRWKENRGDKTPEGFGTSSAGSGGMAQWS